MRTAGGITPRCTHLQDARNRKTTWRNETERRCGFPEARQWPGAEEGKEDAEPKERSWIAGEAQEPQLKRSSAADHLGLSPGGFARDEELSLKDLIDQDEEEEERELGVVSFKVRKQIS